MTIRTIFSKLKADIFDQVCFYQAAIESGSEDWSNLQEEIKDKIDTAHSELVGILEKRITTLEKVSIKYGLQKLQVPKGDYFQKIRTQKSYVDGRIAELERLVSQLKGEVKL